MIIGVFRGHSVSSLVGSTTSGPTVEVGVSVTDGMTAGIDGRPGVVAVGMAEILTLVGVMGTPVGIGVIDSLSDKVVKVVLSVNDGDSSELGSEKVEIGTDILVNATVEVSTGTWLVVNAGITDDKLLVNAIVLVIMSKVDWVRVVTGSEVIIGGGFKRKFSISELTSPATE